LSKQNYQKIILIIFFISIGEPTYQGLASRQVIPFTSGTKEPIITISFSHNINSILNAFVMTVKRNKRKEMQHKY
jgi:hypothetical protein